MDLLRPTAQEIVSASTVNAAVVRVDTFLVVITSAIRNARLDLIFIAQEERVVQMVYATYIDATVF